MVDATINITTEDNVVMMTGLMERFYLPVENQWVCAKDLKEGDCLLNEDLEYITITKVEKSQGQAVMFLISVDNKHNFLASQGRYLVHNGPIGAAIGCYIGATLVLATYGGISTLLATACGPASMFVMPAWYYWTSASLTAAVHIGGVAGGLIGGVATGPV